MDENFNPAVQPESEQTPVSQKSRTVALVLAIALGTLGINRLYLGIRGGVSRLVRYIIAMTMAGIVFGILFIILGMSHGVMNGFYYDPVNFTTKLYVLLAVDYAALGVMLALLIPNTVGAIKDIVRTSKGIMTDAQGLPVTKW